MEINKDRRFLRVKGFVEEKMQSKFYFSDEIYLCKILRQALTFLKFNCLNEIEQTMFKEDKTLKDQIIGNQLKRYVLLNLETEPRFKQNPKIYKNVKSIIEINLMIEDILDVINEAEAEICETKNIEFEKA